MREHGQLQDDFKSIQVAGTNGKGSVVAMLDAVLREAGLRVGRFTGPHLLRWNERIHIDGKPISDHNFADLVGCLRMQSEEFGRRHPEWGKLTWFEFITALAFSCFAEAKVDIAVVEVGLGGRWDATSVLTQPLVTAITHVELDHIRILGPTLGDIAREKAGIIRGGIPVVTAASGPALDLIASTAQGTGARLIRCTPPDRVDQISFSHADSSYDFSCTFKQMHDPCSVTEENFLARARIEILSDREPLKSMLAARPQLSLSGTYQQVNALVACSVLYAAGQALTIPDLAGCVQRGFTRVYWPGRMQFLPEQNLVLDGAHNPSGASALRQALDEAFPGQSFFFVLACFQGKDLNGMLDNLLTLRDRVFACETVTRRAACSAEEIACACKARSVRSASYPALKTALLEALSKRSQGQTVVVTGSLAAVAEAMKALGWKKVEDGLRSTSRSRRPALLGV